MTTRRAGGTGGLARALARPAAVLWLAAAAALVACGDDREHPAPVFEPSPAPVEDDIETGVRPDRVLIPRDDPGPSRAPPTPPTPPTPPAPDGREAAILRDVVRLAGLERRVDAVDGTTVLFEVLPGARTLDHDGAASGRRVELQARVRADASAEPTVQRITVEVRLDPRTGAVVSARVIGRTDADDAALEDLVRTLRR